MLPMLIGVIVSVLASGALVSAIGYYVPFMFLGTILMSVGAGLLSTWTPSTSNALLIVYPAIFGAGVGIAFQQPIIAAQTVLSEADIPVGTSIVVFGQSIGAAIILSVAETVFSNRLAANIRDMLGLAVTTESLLGGGIKDVVKAIVEAGGDLAKLVDAENKAVTQAFYVSLAMAGLSVIGALTVEWKSVKKEEERRKAEGMM
jgi:MFS family permease